MQSSTKPFRTPAIRRTHLNVPLDEMRRLMRVYGSTKCLRKRQPPGGGCNAKEESVKRKFYRWFPDLEERFAKDAAGFWRPRFGHEFERNHREKMRKKDREVTSKKRTTSKLRTMRTQKCRRTLGAEADAPGGAEAPMRMATKVSSRAERAAALLVTSASGIGDRGSKPAETLSVSGYKAAPTSLPVGSSAKRAAPPIVMSSNAPAATAAGSGAERAAALFVPSTSGGGDEDFEQAVTFSVSNCGAASVSMDCNPVSTAPPLIAKPRFDQEWTTIEVDEPELSQALLISARSTASPVNVRDPVATASRLQPCSNQETTRSEDAHAVSIINDALNTSAQNMASSVTACNPVNPPSHSFAFVQPCLNQELTRSVDVHATSIISNNEPLDVSFVAEQGIFDDVERSFYGAYPPRPIEFGEAGGVYDACPGLALSSTCGSASSDDASPSVDDTLDEFMAEYCEEVLASGGEDDASASYFDKL